MELSRTYQNLPKLSQPTGPTWTYQNLLKPIETYQKLPESIETYRNIPGSIKTYQKML